MLLVWKKGELHIKYIAKKVWKCDETFKTCQLINLQLEVLARSKALHLKGSRSSFMMHFINSLEYVKHKEKLFPGTLQLEPLITAKEGSNSETATWEVWSYCTWLGTVSVQTKFSAVKWLELTTNPPLNI